jgi:hypothetical protein
MSRNYPSPLLPLVTPVLEPIIGNVVVPYKIIRDYNLQPNLKLKDLTGLLGINLPQGSLDVLADIVNRAVNSRYLLLSEYAVPVSEVPLKFQDLIPELSSRVTNALIRYGLDYSDDLSTIQVTIGDLVSVQGLGTKGVLEILSNVFVQTNSYYPLAEDDYNVKKVVSRNLNRTLDILLKKRWSTKIYKHDPRMSNYLLSINIKTDVNTAKEVANSLKNVALPPSMARGKQRDIIRFIKKADELTKLKLKTEITQIIESIEPSTRAQQIIISRLGADGRDPETLEKVGESMGITRERVRQIEAKFMSKLRQRSPVWTPVFDKTLSILQNEAPIRKKDLLKILKERGLIRGDFSIESLVNLSKVLEKDIDVEYDPDKKLIAASEFLEILPHVNFIAAALVTHWGATTLEQLNDELQKQKIKIDKTQLIYALEQRRDFTWLDKKDGWFWLKSAQKNRVLNYVEKIMSVAGSIELSELRNGTGRWHRVHGYRLPKKILMALCLTTGQYSYSDGKLIGNENLPDWRLILASGERKIVEILFDNNYAMRRADLEEKATAIGVGRGSFYVYIGYSPVLERYAPGVYGLRGAPVTAAQVEALIPPILRKSRIFRDNGWTENGNLWIGYKISNSSSISGVVGLPSSLSKFVAGSYRLKTETDEPVGTLTIRNNNMWGLSPFFRRWGVEADDYIVIEFDSKSKEARITTGDQELITGYQDSVNDVAIPKGDQVKLQD